jgi:hypothetical protein
MKNNRLLIALILGLGLTLILALFVLTSRAAPTAGPPLGGADAGNRAQDATRSNGVLLSPSTQAGSGQPGTLVTYTLWLTNLTGTTASFTLTIQPGNAWTTTLSLTQTGTLDPSGNLSFTLGVEIPPSASAGDSESATIRATSVASPTVYSATATITTTVDYVPGPIFLPLVVRAWPPLPEAPVLNAIVVGDHGHYTINWSSVALADTYVLEEATRADFVGALVAYEGPSTSYTVTDPSPGSYYYRVKAVNDGSASGWSNGQYIFHDNFSNPASGWAVVDDEYLRVEYLNGEYRMLSKEAGYFYLVRAPAGERQTYVVEVDARWDTWHGSSYGLIFGLTSDWSQYYLFDINTDYQQFRLLRRDASGFTAVVPVSDAPAINSGAASNHLKVVRNGAQITLEVNGTALGTWFDGTIGGLTRAGLVTNPYNNRPISDARFDNFAITSLPGSGASAQAPGGAMVGEPEVAVSKAWHVPVPLNTGW